MMFFIFLSLLASIPLWVGLSIIFLFKKNTLSKIIFLSLLLATIWQLDVTFLYSYHLLEKGTIEFFFRLFRFGAIMVTPTIFYVAYTIFQEHLPDHKKRKWKGIINKQTLLLFYGIAFLAYAVGWSDKGISSLKIMQYGTSKFYFPIYGELSWIFYINVILFVVCMTICFLINLDIPVKSTRSFLLNFNISITIGFAIGVLNMFPQLRLYASAVAVLVFAIAVLILSSKMYMEVVSNMNQQLHEQREFLRKIIDINPNYIYARDEEGRYTLVNQSYAILLGVDSEEIVGKTHCEIQQEEPKADLEKCPGVLSIEEEELVTHTGESKWVQTAKVPFTTNEGYTLLAVSTDITERKQHEEEIKYQAYHDALTGLPNRRMFNEDLSALFDNAKADDTRYTIMLLDLDRFKYINDTLGHDYGDQLLIEVARRLQLLLKKKSDSRVKMYRLGGDEFTLLLPDHDEKASVAFAKDLLREFKKGFSLDGSEYFITPSIGISMFPDDGTDAKTLMKHADTAMYYVKERGKNNYQLFSNEMHQYFYKKMIIEKQLRTAIENGEFELYYQPIIKINTNEMVGMEALLRWNNPTLGQVPPVDFISVAEETGMIISIGEWVLRMALEQNTRWQKEGHRPLRMGVNISVRQLLDPLFLDRVKNIMEDVGADPAYIVLEVTESIAMYEAEAMIEKLCALKRLGVSLSMDDFGTGYSSLSYLKKYPLDSLKIDQSFVMGMNQDEGNRTIVKTIIAMARSLDLTVTAEGVEGHEEYQYLAATNCDTAQGYGISPPIPAKELEEKWL